MPVSLVPDFLRRVRKVYGFAGPAAAGVHQSIRTPSLTLIQSGSTGAREESSEMHILHGDHGKIYTYHDEGRGHWRARFQYKPLLSDKVKPLTATGSTKGKAESNLKQSGVSSGPPGTAVPQRRSG